MLLLNDSEVSYKQTPRLKRFPSYSNLGLMYSAECLITLDRSYSYTVRPI